MNMQGLHYDLDSLFPESPDFLQEEEICSEDYFNMRRLYPVKCRSICNAVEEYIDMYEYDGSIIYHEYPDEVSISLMADDVYNMCGYDDDSQGSILDIIQIILCNEIYMRRRRHDRFCRNFKTR